MNGCSMNGMRGLAQLFGLAFVLLFGYTGRLQPQPITGRKMVCIGELWHEDEDIPSGGFHRSFCWPGNHYRAVGAAKPMDLMNGCARECGLGYGMKNWTDWKNKFYPYMVGGVGESLMVYPNGGRFGCVGHIFKIVLREPPPRLIVDNALQPARQEYDELDPQLISDAAFVIKWSFDVGLTIEQTYYAYASAPFDSYLFIDFKVQNTGNVNQNLNTVELKNQVLHDLCFTYAFLPMVSHEGAEQVPNSVIETNTDDWVEYYGENYLEYLGGGSPLHPAGNRAADSLRIFYAWDGNNGKSSWDDTGDPDMNTGFYEQSPGMGRLLSSQYLGMGVLHADKSATDTTNDLSQPFSTVWRVGTKLFSSCQEAYEYYFGAMHMDSPQEMGFDRPDDPLTVARPNPYVSIGPYEMPFASDIHFTLLAAVNGIHYDACNAAGLSWWTRWKGREGLTDAEKNQLVASGKDSLFKYFSQATRRYFRNLEKGRHPFDAPEPPPPPALTVTSAEKSVILQWRDVSQAPDHDTGIIDFAGYRVYRSVGRNDTTFAKIWECGGNTGIPVTTEYIDRTVQRGFAYFYYVTAYDDGSQNWESPGRSLESGKYWNMMVKNRPAHPFMSSAQIVDLKNIKVVPNPYHDKSVRYNWPGEENKLLFINVPLACTIKIFTASGDLVKTIYHDNQTTEQAWNQVTDSNQLIYSGVYFYLLESDIGRQTGKFVVVRSSSQGDE